MSPAFFSSSLDFWRFPHVLSLSVWPVFAVSSFEGRILGFGISL